MQVRPDDSVSNVGTRSLLSRASRSSRTSQTSRSSSASARAKAAARKAILEAEATTLKQLHQIEEEELKLRQHKTKLKFETELVKAEAEELVYAQVEEREMAATYFPIEEPQATISTDPAPDANGFETDVKEDEVAPIADGIESENRSAPFNPTVLSAAKSEEPARHLNSEAPAWLMKRVKEAAPGQNSVPQATPVTPPKGDIQLLLHQQQEAIMALISTAT